MVTPEIKLNSIPKLPKLKSKVSLSGSVSLRNNGTRKSSTNVDEIAEEYHKPLTESTKLTKKLS